MKFKSANNPALQERLADKLEGVTWHGSHYYTCRCPSHFSTPVRNSLFVYPDGYRCASCGIFGSLNKLEKLLAGIKVGFKDEEEIVINELPKWLEYKKEHGSYKAAAKYAYKTGKEYPMLMKYMKQRGLEDVVEFGGVGYIDGWLSFPVFDDMDNFVDWVLRATPSVQTTSKYVVRPRKNRSEGFRLYVADWYKFIDEDEIYVPFGILDMWTLYLCGLSTATGMTGKTYNPSWFDDVRKKIYLIPDAGEEDSAYKLKANLGWRAQVLRLDYETGKDPNDLLQLGGIQLVKEKIELAKKNIR